MGYVLQYTVTTFKVASHKLLHVVQYRHENRINTEIV